MIDVEDLKKVLVSLTIGGIVTAGILVATQAPSWGRHDLSTFSHVRLEADRVMTLQMGTDISPGMAVQMSGYGMLERSS